MENNRLWKKRISNPTCRNKVLGILACIFVLLVPNLGWNPLLLLWCIHLSFLIKETTSKTIKTINLALLVFAILLICLNLIMRFLHMTYVIRF